MRVELINCEGAVLKCTVGRFNVSLLAFLLDGQGYIKFTPRLEHLYKYLLGHFTLENINLRILNQSFFLISFQSSYESDQYLKYRY